MLGILDERAGDRAVRNVYKSLLSSVIKEITVVHIYKDGDTIKQVIDSEEVTREELLTAREELQLGLDGVNEAIALFDQLSAENAPESPTVEPGSPEETPPVEQPPVAEAPVEQPQPVQIPVTEELPQAPVIQ